MDPNSGELLAAPVPARDDFTSTVDGAAAHARQHWDRDDSWDSRDGRPDVRDTL